MKTIWSQINSPQNARHSINQSITTALQHLGGKSTFSKNIKLYYHIYGAHTEGK